MLERFLLATIPVFFFCKKPGVSGKPNAQKKKSLTNIVYLANAIASYVKGFIRVEEHKAATSNEITTLLITFNETINKGNNGIIFNYAYLKVKAQCKITFSQERIAAIFAVILVKGVPLSYVTFVGISIFW